MIGWLESSFAEVAFNFSVFWAVDVTGKRGFSFCEIDSAILVDVGPGGFLVILGPLHFWLSPNLFERRCVTCEDVIHEHIFLARLFEKYVRDSKIEKTKPVDSSVDCHEDAVDFEAVGSFK